MKKKELLKEVSQVTLETSDLDVDFFGTKLYIKICKINAFHSLFYLLFIGLSLLMYHKINNLSFISETFYFVFVTIMMLSSTAISTLFFTLYIYNRKTNNLISRKQLKISYKFYQIHDVVSFVGLFLAAFLWLLIFVVTPVRVSGTSMENTFKEDDKLLVWHIGYTPDNNDVVIIDSIDNYPKLHGVDLIIKRVIAVSGDVVTYENEDIYVNDILVYTNATIDEFRQILTLDSDGTIYYDGYRGVVPSGYTIVLGDNRINSYDSKSIGLIHNEDIIGKCIVRIFPLSEIGIIN